MAPTLSSNSFLISSTPGTRFSARNPRLRVVAKRSGPFQIGKQKEVTDDNASSDDVSGNSSPFSFNFGKVPDVKSLIPVVSQPNTSFSFANIRRKDPGTVFVAGATGLTGIRITQTLLREGFSVRAGVPELGAAQELALLAAKYKIISKEDAKRLNAVESTYEDVESIAKAIGNASKVVVTIGSTENGPTSEVSTSDALQVIQAAQLAGIGHAVIVYDGNATSASTYNVLDGITSFFHNLFSKSQPLSIPELLQKLIETDVSYTFIKTGLTNDFSPESSYNLVVSPERSVGANDYKVGMSQIASVVANVFANTAVAENKVVEVFTDPSAPSKSVAEFLSVIPEDGRRKAYAESLAKAKAEEEARVAAEAAVAAQKREKEAQNLSEQKAKAANLAEDAQEKADAAGKSVENFLSKAKELGSGFSWEKLSDQVNTAVQSTYEKEIPKIQLATVRGQAKARSLPSQRAVVKPSARKPPASKPKVEPKTQPKEETEPKKEVRKVFGGLFKQETIYVDDD